MSRLALLNPGAVDQLQQKSRNKSKPKLCLLIGEIGMVRTIDEKAYAEKRNEILDVVQRFVFTTGYESMSIKSVIRELEILSGAFYHLSTLHR